jgi:hypothetical protein
MALALGVEHQTRVLELRQVVAVTLVQQQQKLGRLSPAKPNYFS